MAAHGATDGGATKADARRARVIAAAVDIFSRRGYRGTSMSEIAAEVGLAKPTLYHYFRSKEELLVRIYEGVLDESVAEARDIRANAPDPLEALRRLIVARVLYTCQHKNLLKICFEEEEELPPDLAGPILARRREFDDIFLDAVIAHLDAGGTHPAMAPRVYANTCLGAVNWTYKWYDPSGPETPEQLGAAMASDLLLAISSH